MPNQAVRDLSTWPLEEVERAYQAGRVTHAQVAEYLRLWNAGPHFNQAILTDGRIRLFDPESSIYRLPAFSDLHIEFGVRL